MSKKIIGQFVVGSRLHNLHNENSDYDYRGIHMSSLSEILSPFKKNKNTTWIEGNIDNTSFELIDFCKMAVQGNPTILEILYSDITVVTSPEMQELRENRHKFLDSKRMYEASKGYAHNQLVKMDLFNPNNRSPKLAVAYLRILWQTSRFLISGELPTEVYGEARDFLLKVKNASQEEFALLVPKISEMFGKYQKELEIVYSANEKNFTPDIEWIEDFLVRAYRGEFPSELEENLYLVYHPNDFSVSGQAEIPSECFALVDLNYKPIVCDKATIDSYLANHSQDRLIALVMDTHVQPNKNDNCLLSKILLTESPVGLQKNSNETGHTVL